MTAENTFDNFLKDQLGFLKGSYDRLEYVDLQSAIDQASKLGFFELNGSEESFSPLCSLLRKSIRFDGGFAMTVFIQAVVQSIFKSAGFEKNGLIAYPPFQSLPSDISLCATKEGGKYLVQGTAPMVPLAREANHVLIPAKLGEEFSFFLVPCAGFERVPVIGMRTLPLYDLSFEKTDASLVGKEGLGLAYFSDMARPLRIAASAMMLGLLENSYNEAFSYGYERVQGGRKIIEWSEHKMMLSQMLAKLKVCENLLAYCVGKSGTLTDAESISTLIHFQDSLAEMTSTGVQAMGGAGYMKDYPLERFYRDGHQLRCLFGTAPFHKLDLFSLEGHGKA